MTKEAYEKALCQRQGNERTNLFSRATVAICGLGGLGSAIALMLARSGVGRLVVIDHDEVELSNIHRQQYRISQIGQKKTDSIKELIGEVNPYCDVITKNVIVTEENIGGLLAEADVVCEAFDKPENKAMLVNTMQTLFPEKPVVTGSGMAGFGDANAIRTKHITPTLTVCGDGVSDVATQGSLVAARVGICAGHQALSILARIEGLEREEDGR
ncbi:sulfur carrier protein ThiS adenylyltransferase [Lachnospiraceae bacterium XBB1006]|nr:sulfur carrier protein ThiS adenylyltransferase [Lachnospiraceae bacterium XBB1006]